MRRKGPLVHASINWPVSQWNKCRPIIPSMELFSRILAPLIGDLYTAYRCRGEASCRKLPAY